MHGGRRPGAGRKSNAEVRRVRELMDEAISEEMWVALFRALFDTAARGGGGSNQAAQILLQYRFGPPQPESDAKEDGPLVHIYLPDNSPKDALGGPTYIPPAGFVPDPHARRPQLTERTPKK